MLQHQHDFDQSGESTASLGDVLGGRAPLQRSLTRKRPSSRHLVAHPSGIWREKDDVVYVLVGMSDKTGGAAWVRRLKLEQYEVREAAEKLLSSTSFHPTSDMVRLVAILKGRHVLGRHTIAEVQEAFRKHSLALPHPETACLLRMRLTAKHFEEIGLSHIVVAHAPFPGQRKRLVLGPDDLHVCETHDPIDLGHQKPGVAFIAWEYASPLSIAA